MSKTVKVRFSIIIFSLFALASLNSCLNNSNSTAPHSVLDLVKKADSYDQLSTFSEYADSLNIKTRLSESDTYTLFAPTNNAFSQLSDGMLDTLSQKQLGEVISYHIADSTYFTSQFNATQQLQTLMGEELFIEVGAKNIFINDGELVGGNIRATNGVLHATNTVLFPDSYLNVYGVIAKRHSLNSMESALEEAEMVDTLSNDTENGFTVFVPSNSAFEGVSPPENQQALQDTLQYHIIPQTFRSDDFQSSQTLETLNGEELTIEVDNNTITINDSATITIPDLEGTNGVAHIIDTFLAPPTN